ncbi:MAG: M20 family metallopeptidase, partial [Vicinamibacteria bacterium]
MTARVGSVMSFDLLEEAKRIIGIESESSQGTESLVRHLCSLCAPFDLTLETQSLALRGVSQVNLLAEKGPTTADRVLFVTHLDTVPAGERALWTECGGNPFRATVKGDDLYGLGSADAKVDILCKLKAAERFVGVAFRNRLTILGTFGEEIGLLGARHFLEQRGTDFRYALVGEPSDLEIVTAHKGYIVWEAALHIREPGSSSSQEDWASVLFRGQEAHSSTPDLGDNAIERALSWLSRVIASRGGDFAVGGAQGGDAVNRVPSRCTLIVPRSA